MNNLLGAIAAGLLFTSFSFGQTAPQTLPDNSGQSVEVPKDEKTKTLFSGIKNPLKKINYLGLSLGSEVQYGMLSGQFTPMVGVSGMLHVNKKWGVGLAGYSTFGDQFAPTSLSSTKALNLNSMYGGLKFEYTTKPNAAIHVSFPLLIGAGLSKVDSVGRQDGGNRDGHSKENDHNGQDDNYGGDASFFVIQPGMNVEVNVFRFAKIFAGVSYRIVPTVMKEDAATSLFPTPTASQMGGLNLSAGLKVGLFDYQLHRAKRQKKQKTATVQ